MVILVFLSKIVESTQKVCRFYLLKILDFLLILNIIIYILRKGVHMKGLQTPLSDDEMTRLKNYCKKNGLMMGQFIRVVLLQRLNKAEK